MGIYPFTAVTHNRADIVILELLEVITTESTPRLAETLEMLINDGNNRILLDFEKVETICSTGLGILHYYHSIALENNGEMKIINASSFVSKVILQTLGNDSFEIFSCLDEALKSFSKIKLTSIFPDDNNDN